MRANDVRMVGYARTGYKLWDPETDTILESRDVRFDENEYKFQNKINIQKGQSNSQQYYDISNTNERVNQPNENSYIEGRNNDQVQDEAIPSDDEIENDQKEVIETRTKSGRKTQIPKNLTDYEIYQAYCLTSYEDPESYEDALKLGWKDAIENELDAHRRMMTWSECELPYNRKAIDAKWIFRTKDHGLRKARLVVKGFQLKDEENFRTNYSPVARISTIRVALAHTMQYS